MKNKTIRMVTFFLTLFSALNCAPILSNRGLSFSIAEQRVVLMNSVADKCTSTNTSPAKSDKGIKAISFQVPSLSIAWTGAAPLTISAITFNLTSPSLSSPYSCSFSGSELLSTWIYMHGVTDVNNTPLGCPIGANGAAAATPGVLNTDLIINPSTLASATTAMPTLATDRCLNKIYTSNACPFRCGDIKFNDPNLTSASGSVEIKIDGFYDQGNGTFSNISLKRYMTFSYSI